LGLTLKRSARQHRAGSYALYLPFRESAVHAAVENETNYHRDRLSDLAGVPSLRARTAGAAAKSGGTGF
jgi:hypothetical protein